MENVSAVTSFILTAYFELEDHRYLYIGCMLLIYLLIVFINSVLIFVIYTERGLHSPMYLFILNLGANGIFGTTCLFPSMLSFLSTRHYEISLALCLLQIYFIYVYCVVEFTILAVMSYDRYAAICHPLHYHNLMSPRRVYSAIALSWVFPGVFIAVNFIPTLQRSFCGRIIDKVYCENFALIELSCYDHPFQYSMILASLFFTPVPQIIMVLFSYMQILRICLSASKESQMKALQTCTPHILSVMMFSLGILVAVINRYPSLVVISLTEGVKIFRSLYFLIIPALFNPVVYGMSIQAIRVPIFNLFMCKKSQ